MGQAELSLDRVLPKVCRLTEKLLSRVTKVAAGRENPAPQVPQAFASHPTAQVMTSAVRSACAWLHARR